MVVAVFCGGGWVVGGDGQRGLAEAAPRRYGVTGGERGEVWVRGGRKKADHTARQEEEGGKEGGRPFVKSSVLLSGVRFGFGGAVGWSGKEECGRLVGWLVGWLVGC